MSSGASGGPGGGKPEPKEHLIVCQFTRALKAVALVELDRAAVALTGARTQHLDAESATEVLDDQIERGSAVALPLVTLVNEQHPQEVGYVVGTCDLVGDHHEPDGRVVDIYPPVQGMSGGVFGGF